MGKPTGFLEYPRELPARRAVEDRLLDYLDVYEPFPAEKLQRQAARCMDCGVPFCTSGCPLGNLIPDWNDLVYNDRWREAFERLRATNNFPEFTGRICPAPCESACVLGLIEPAVTIERIEQEIIEHAYREGWVQPCVPTVRTGKRVAVVGSGPAGLAAADQLNQAGHQVTVFERDSAIGGLLRFGIPDFKLEKWVLDRRIGLMEAEGVRFEVNADMSLPQQAERLRAFDAVVLCIGATRPRDLPIPGRELGGIHFAWDYLKQQNLRVAENDDRSSAPISAAGRHVIVIGGGDTGSDCVGTANRQGAVSVTQFEVLPTPPRERPAHQPWPYMPVVLSVTSSHEEGADRHWSILTRAFHGTGGQVERLETVDVNFVQEGERRVMAEAPESERHWPADLVLLAIGYTGPEPEGVVAQLGVELDGRGNIQTDAAHRTSVPGVFAAGDARRGQSLVVWAISEGRETARHVDQYLMERAVLPSKGPGDLPRAA